MNMMSRGQEQFDQGKTAYSRVVVDNSQRNVQVSRFVSDLVAGGSAPGIVFVRHKRHAKVLSQAIACVLKQEVPFVTSDIPRPNREALIAQMKTGNLPVAVATGVWDQGIDIPNLAWVLMAGEGQAPVGYKQKAGRPTRLAPGKEGYVIYDLRTVGSGTPSLDEQARKRLQHYAAAGFSVEGVRVTAEERAGGGPDVELLAELLEMSLPEEHEWRRLPGGSIPPPEVSTAELGLDARLIWSDARGSTLFAKYILNPKPWWLWVLILVAFFLFCYIRDASR